MKSTLLARSTAVAQPPATCGRLLAASFLAANLLLPSATNAGDPTNQHHSPYTHPRPSDSHPYLRPHTDRDRPATRPGPRTWTGLQLEPGTSVALTFGTDPYHDGATLAAILHGLQPGEVLLLERTETGARLRRHGGRVGSAYDDLDFKPDPAGRQP